MEKRLSVEEAEELGRAMIAAGEEIPRVTYTAEGEVYVTFTVKLPKQEELKAVGQ